MNDTKRNHMPHEEGFYQTGAATRPRSHGTLVLILLVAVVLLVGVLTILSLLNIRLFVTLKNQEKDALKLQNTQASTSETSLKSHQPAFSIELEENQEDLTLQQIYAGCIDSVVSVRSDGTTGTGLVLTDDGYILTDCTLVKDARELTVELADQRCLTARVIGMDDLLNLAVLHVDAPNLAAPVFGNSNELEQGDTVISIGDPLGENYDGILSNGNISSVSGDAICTDGLHSQAGPLLNRFGQVVGFQIGESGYAIPSATVKKIVEQLVNQGYVSGRPGLGIRWEQVPELHQKYYALPAGLYITGADGHSALSVGDILISLNGKQITSEEELLAALYACKIGDVVQLEIFRNDSVNTVTVTVVEYKG